MVESDAHCIFCKIISGEMPAEKIFEDERVVVFRDANPVAAIHILIAPREHIPTLNDVPEDNNILSHIGQVARRVAESFGVDQAGYRLVINVNRGGGQVIFHLHAHLISKSHPARR
jgi:histidine triad (HIT) family protein